MFISFNMFILLIVATILMIFLIIYLTVTGNDKNNKKKQKKETKRTTPTLNKKTTVPPSQKPNVVTDVAKRASRKSKPYNEHNNQPLERTRLLNLHEANVINENGP